MSERSEPNQLKRAGVTAWRGTILAVASLIVLAMFFGMAYLVYLDRLADGPLILFAGVLLGYLLRSVRDWR